ncbi:MAG: guanylate kinase [Hyphomicrobiales bacterium]|nr:guanylate kinase [Hyphomicrobiales bacterium]
MASLQDMVIERRGLMLAISSPSGAGKTTLTRMLIDGDANLQLSVSATTRPRRSNEEDGVHYSFVAERDFILMRDAGAFIEWAHVFGNFYGTPKQPVEAALGNGRDVVFDVDWQGVRQLQHQARPDLATVFILPPSRASLHERLQKRGADDDSTVRSRMAAASAEISHWSEYDYVLVNDDLNGCAASLRAILQAERLKRERRTGLIDFVSQLMVDA